MGRNNLSKWMEEASDANRHKARMPRPHLATELAERSSREQGEEACRHCFPRLRTRLLSPTKKVN